jgi:hypothetical protein
MMNKKEKNKQGRGIVRTTIWWRYPERLTRSEEKAWDCSVKDAGPTRGKGASDQKQCRPKGKK